MDSVTNGSGQRNSYCWEQINRSHRLFRVSHVFASADCADRLVPLYAFFAAIEQICSTISDEDVARSKLGWWSKEFEHQNRASSQHPLIKALIQAEVADRLTDEPLGRLFHGAANRIAATAPTDSTALKSLCIETCRPQLELEFGACGAGQEAARIAPALLARNGLMQLIRESLHQKEQGRYWWIPLNTLARHEVSREDLLNKPGSPQVVALVKDLLGEAIAWDEKSDKNSVSPTGSCASVRHFFAFAGLNKRKLRRLANLTPDQFGLELSRVGPGDLLCAWKSARRAA